MEWTFERDRENIVLKCGLFHEKVYSLIMLQIKTVC